MLFDDYDFMFSGVEPRCQTCNPGNWLNSMDKILPISMYMRSFTYKIILASE